MKIFATSDWHLGNLFHGNDRLPEHRHFLLWLLDQLVVHRPDALLVAGDVFDNGNPSSEAQKAYYEFLTEATSSCPDLQIVITAGNHDSAARLEAPRSFLSHHHVEVRGGILRFWQPSSDGNGHWTLDYDDLIIPIHGSDNSDAAVLAVPYLRSDTVKGSSYSQGVNTFLRELTERARILHPGIPLVMMAHMYAQGADIASLDASEKIVVGGQEEVNMEGWSDHPDYLTCGHIHKRQHIWNTDWARYTGSALPMSFAEVNYRHGVDMLTLEAGKPIAVSFLEYTPQHRLRVLPDDGSSLSPNELKHLIAKSLRPRPDNQLSENFDYVTLNVEFKKFDNDTIRELECLVASKDAVLCGIHKQNPDSNLTTIAGDRPVTSIDDILRRNPLETLREAYTIHFGTDMSESQTALLQDLLSNIHDENDD